VAEARRLTRGRSATGFRDRGRLAPTSAPRINLLHQRNVVFATGGLRQSLDAAFFNALNEIADAYARTLGPSDPFPPAACVGANASAFWTFWSLSDIEWTFPRFALALGMPSVMYFNAAALVPADPVEVPSWEAYCSEVRHRFYGGAAAWAVVAMAATTLNPGMPWSHPARIVQVLKAVVGVVGVISPSPKTHGVLCVIFAVAVARRHDGGRLPRLADQLATEASP